MKKESIQNINTPHNNFFIQVLSRKDKAIAFFTKYLPAQILEIANLDQIELVESKHMSDAGISLYNDVLSIDALYRMVKWAIFLQWLSINLLLTQTCP